MAEDKSFGGMAKRWLKAQSKELLTSDRHERAQADVEGNRAEHDIKEKATEEAFLTAIPGLRDLKERSEAAQLARDAEREQRRIDELAARPLAGVGLAVTGDAAGSWAGQLPAKVELRPDYSYDENGDEIEIGTILVVDLEARDHDVPLVGGLPLHSWRFVVPGFTGPGTYDLAEIVRRREEEGGYVEYTDWCIALGHPDDPLYWAPDVGPGTVEVGPDGRALVVRMTTQGAGIGPVDVVASVNLPE